MITSQLYVRGICVWAHTLYIWKTKIKMGLLSCEHCVKEVFELYASPFLPNNKPKAILFVSSLSLFHHYHRSCFIIVSSFMIIITTIFRRLFVVFVCTSKRFFIFQVCWRNDTRFLLPSLYRLDSLSPRWRMQVNRKLYVMGLIAHRTIEIFVIG